MHVAFVTDVALPYVSGVTIAVRRQRDALRATGVGVTVAGPAGDVDLPQPWVHVPGAPAGHRLAVFGPGLARSLRRVDVVHAHSVFGASLAARRIARAAGVPLVVTLHTWLAEYAHYARALSRVVRPLLPRYVASVLARADLVVAPSSELADWIASRVTTPLRVVAAPVDPRLAAGDAARGRTLLRVAPDAPLILSTSRIAPEKRVEDLVTALSRVSDTRAVLAFAGAGASRDSLVAHSRSLGVAPRVLTVGQLDTADLADALAAADVVASASRSETQGLAVCEAAAAGRAVVAPARGAYAEVLADGAGLFPSRAPDPVEVAASIDRLLADAELRARLGAEARRRAAVWSPDTVAASLRAAYESVRK